MKRKNRFPGFSHIFFLFIPWKAGQEQATVPSVLVFIIILPKTMSNIDPKLIPRLNNINLLPFYTEMDIEGWEFPPAFKLNDHISFFVPLIEFVVRKY